MPITEEEAKLRLPLRYLAFPRRLKFKAPDLRCQQLIYVRSFVFKS